MTQKLMKVIVVLNDDETWSSLDDTHLHMVDSETYNAVSNSAIKWGTEVFIEEHFEWSISIKELLDFYLTHHKELGYTPLDSQDAA